MPEIDCYFDEIDASRIRRVRELSEVKRRFSLEKDPDPAGINSKAAVVLAYATWEGFYNECVRSYIQFLKGTGKKIRETDWMLMAGALGPEFESLRAKNHSTDAKQQFVVDLKARLDCGFDAFDMSSVQAKSNLDFKRLSQNFFLLNFDLGSFQRYRNRLDKELVGWRHGVAHGDPPDLASLDIADHVDFTAQLLIVLADLFQTAMLERM